LVLCYVNNGKIICCVQTLYKHLRESTSFISMELPPTFQWWSHLHCTTILNWARWIKNLYHKQFYVVLHMCLLIICSSEKAIFDVLLLDRDLWNQPTWTQPNKNLWCNAYRKHTRRKLAPKDLIESKWWIHILEWGSKPSKECYVRCPIDSTLPYNI